MDEGDCPVLAMVVDRYDSTDRPVTRAVLADTLDIDEGAVADRLARLIDCELVAPAGDGYRPTVTGREFLALDVDCGPVIVDLDDCESATNG